MSICMYSFLEQKKEIGKRKVKRKKDEHSEKQLLRVCKHSGLEKEKGTYSHKIIKKERKKKIR